MIVKEQATQLTWKNISEAVYDLSNDKLNHKQHNQHVKLTPLTYYSWNPIILSNEVLDILSNEKWNHKYHN